MIVKNEEETLPRCLVSVKPVVDEMIVVDTGSTDRTKEIARVFGAKVFDYEWADDFSGARNFSLSKAKGNWILILDADEVHFPMGSCLADPGCQGEKGSTCGLFDDHKELCKTRQYLRMDGQ